VIRQQRSDRSAFHLAKETSMSTEASFPSRPPISWTARAAALALACLALLAIPAGAGAVPFEIESFSGGAFKQNGTEESQAGSHPWVGSAKFALFRGPDLGPVGFIKPFGTLRNTRTEIPPGLVGSLPAVPSCPGQTPTTERCPNNTQVGVAVILNSAGGPGSYWPVYKMDPPPGVLGLFKFVVAGAPVILEARVRSGDDYGVEVLTLNAPQTISIYGVELNLWGVPASPLHDEDRGYDSAGIKFCGEVAGPSCSNPWLAPAGWPAPAVKPFLTLPTSCVGPVQTKIEIETWEGGSDTASFTSPGNEDCAALDFSPTLQARPTTNVADSPSGLEVNLHLPQNEDPNLRAEAHLQDTTVTLPEGLLINPAAANGLGACTEAQFGFTEMQGDVVHTTPDPATCPDAAKLGTVQVDTPALDHPVPGAVYIAQPHQNPFDSLLALYIALDDPQTGIVVKLAGKVEADPVTGQLKATFEENPQLPFEDFHLHFFGGAGGSLRTPATCGTYATTSRLASWAAPEEPISAPDDAWAIEQGPGGSCASEASQLPNAPSFDAGTIAPIAAAKTPLVVNLRRADGSQQFKSLTLTPPQGLVGKLAGIPYCPQSALDEAAAKSGRTEEASPSCPAASYVGSVVAAAGAGPAPYHAQGKAYLTGPYKGAPLSLAIITPATAGPFDLGTIVVRTALYVDRRTTQITAVSDEIPSILQGIPLDVRSIQVKMDRPDFTLNPTSCAPSTFGGQLMSTLGQTAALQSRFQVGECGRLAFKPKLTLALKGSTRRSGNPALTATLQMPEGGANLAAISVALPHSEFLDQSHIRTVCTRVQFAADQCPAAAVYGTATVTTPLLDYPLPGNVYLRSSDNPLPDLVVDLRGPAHQPLALESAGRVDSVKGGIRNSFEFIPDAPFTKLVLSMQGGKKGLLENSTNLCAKTQRATVKYTAHNGETLIAHPPLQARCAKRPAKPGL
jgi:hypothetical protein